MSGSSVHTINLTVDGLNQDGIPFGGHVDFQLSYPFVKDTDFILPIKRERFDFVDGRVVAQLVPNAILDETSLYHFWIIKETVVNGIRVTSTTWAEGFVSIPDRDCNLAELAVVGHQYPDCKDYVAAAVALAQAAAAEAKNDATEATTQAGIATDMANEASESATSAASAATSAFESAATASAAAQSASSAVEGFDEHVLEKTTAFNENAASKVSDFNDNASLQLSAFNSNAQSQTSAFDSNAQSKTDAFDANYDVKKALIDAQVAIAEEKADEAAESASTASTKADEASSSASAASTSASNAAISASAASTSATDASTSASYASASADAAAESESAATTSANAAAGYASQASGYASSSSGHADAAAASAESASQSSDDAAASAESASQSATAASTSASLAEEHEQAAEQSALNSAGSASLADTAKTASQSYANASAASANLSDEYARTARQSADSASSSAGVASSRAAAAQTAADSASTSATWASQNASSASLSAISATNSANRAESEKDKAIIAAEGSDAQARTLGLSHSAMGWALLQGLHFAGEYSATETYAKNNYVKVTVHDETNFYLSLSDDNTGHAVTDTTWWKFFWKSEAGQDGASVRDIELDENGNLIVELDDIERYTDTVDSSMSTTSTHPVQNKAIALALATKQDKKDEVLDTTSSSITIASVAPDTNYTYGELSSFTISAWGSAENNQESHIMFKSGTTPTVMTVSGTNAMFSDFSPSANAVVEIDARYYAPLGKWAVLFAQVPIATE